MDAIPWGGGGVTAYDGPYGKDPLVEAYKGSGNLSFGSVKESKRVNR